MKLAAIRKSICDSCNLDCPVRESIKREDPDTHCPSWKWKDAKWRERTSGVSSTPEFPPITSQLSNAAKSAFQNTKNLVLRIPLAASTDEIERRKEICSGCPQLIDGRCAKCGCFYKTKIKLAAEKCPLGQW